MSLTFETRWERDTCYIGNIAVGKIISPGEECPHWQFDGFWSTPYRAKNEEDARAQVEKLVAGLPFTVCAGEIVHPRREVK